MIISQMSFPYHCHQRGSQRKESEMANTETTTAIEVYDIDISTAQPSPQVRGPFAMPAAS